MARPKDLTGSPFPRLARLLEGVSPPAGVAPISLAVGEPQNGPPRWIIPILNDAFTGWGQYPQATGTAEFRTAVAGWLARRYRLPTGFLDPATAIAPCSGTREGLFLIAFAAAKRARADKGLDDRAPLVLMPNPFYHTYAGAAAASGCEARLLEAGPEGGYLPNLDAIACIFLTMRSFTSVPSLPTNVTRTRLTCKCKSSDRCRIAIS